MVFKRYHLLILLRLVLIVANCFAVVYVWQLHQYWITLYNLIALLLFQVYLMFRHLTRWQNDVRIFSNEVRHGDYSISYRLTDREDEYYDLYQMLNAVSSYVRQLQSQYVQQDQYFKYLVENAQVGLMAYDDKGKILLSNNELLRLLHATQLRSIDQLKLIDSALHEQLSTLPLNQPRLIRTTADQNVRLSARVSKIVIEDKAVYLLSLININPELSENELQSWQDLISVLTHEIMNSVTPIHSLTGSMNKYLDRIEGNDDIVSKAKHSLEVMERRSQSLMHFVDRYRTISTVPLPRLQTIDVSRLISDVLALMESELKDVSVDFQDASVPLEADPSLLGQVFINLIKNALNAMKDNTVKSLGIYVVRDEGMIRISIADNGKGIAENIIGKIFIPFFTTREDGSGIGLTLSRQIMHRHGGTIEVQSKPGGGTRISLLFPSQQR